MAHTRPHEGSRIAELPFDVLVQIFALHRKPAVLLNLASVCHAWRAIIINEHVLWTNFSLDCKTRAAQVLAQLALAGPACELSVTVRLDRHSHWAAMSVYLDTLLQQHARIRYLEFSDAMATVFRNTRDDRFSCVGIVTSLGGKRNWPCLRTLVWQPNSFFDVATDFELDIIAPRLERLELDEVAVDGTFASLGAEGALTNREADNSALFELLRLTTNEDFRELTLENISLSPAPPLATEMRSLDLLQTLTLSNVTLTSGDSVEDVVVIDLPNLRTVSLDCQTASTDLLLMLLPVEGVQAVNMGTHTYLAYDWALPLLSVFDSGDIEITIVSSGLQRTTICVSQVQSRTTRTETWTRAFRAASFVETLNRLDEDMLLFSRLTCLTVDLALIDNAVAFLPSSLPVLRSLTHVRTENDKPKPIVLSDDIRNRFCAIFRSDVALVRETVHSFDGVPRM
ncbi:hypothetical protein EXIGLDRAFT_691246 [Exidia glandulosa HHB12029]|uniref:F-box domain-containing protein n=1 Tax=Exidia glandulosa HHB12029 TaxID=1314781 RepID=A0A165ISY4_EXIGL|nr:hypothetical protein EXIGLDRAFT_691246 [Exidia glandulosa HHB12029]